MNKIDRTGAVIGTGVVFVILVAIIAWVARRISRRNLQQRIANNAQTETPQHPPQHPPQLQQHLRNPHVLPNPYQAPLQPRYHRPVHAIQPLPYHNHHHHPHTVLFPSQPLQTYFPLAPRQQPSTVDGDHSLRPAVNESLSLEDLNTFDAKGDDKHSPCPICLDPLEDEPVSTGNCLHLAHTSCLKSWLVKDRQFACPVCRVPFTDTPDVTSTIPLAAPG